MDLKRLYDWDAPRERWTTREEPCPTCKGKGVVVNAAGTGVEPCSGAAIKSDGPVHSCVKGTLQVVVPPVRTVELRRLPKHQHFSPSLLEQGEAEGWIRRDGKLLTLQGVALIGGAEVPAMTAYQVVQRPGFYCCHCDRLCDDGPAAKAHVATAHGAWRSPDVNNPAGYRRDAFYAGLRLEGATPLPADEALALYRTRRRAQLERIREKYGDTRGKAEVRNAGKAAQAGRTTAHVLLMVVLAAAAMLAGQWVLSALFAGGPFLGAADLVLNIAKGRVVELYNRVDTNDPTNSALIVVVIDAAGDTDATIRDRDTLSALLGGTSNEVTNTNYARKVLTDSDLTAFAPDDTNDRTDLDIADQTWTAVAAGTAWTDILICYDGDTTGGDDTNIVPMTLHDFAVTPDGSDITAQIAAAGFFRAS